jgi:hypothetical protein
MRTQILLALSGLALPWLAAPAKADMACSQILQYCISHVSSMQVPPATQAQYSKTCSRFYATAQRTGTWPAFQSYPAMTCARS